MKKKKWIIGALASMCSLSLLLTGVVSGLAEDTYAFSGGLTENTYTIYEQFVVPEGKFGTVDAQSYVRFPDGTKRTSNAFTLTQGGEYQVEYTATVNGKNYSESFDFFVETTAYSVEKDGSSVTYGKDEKYGTTNEGLIVKLTEGDVFHYNKVVNVLGTTASVPAFDFGFYPETKGIQDANKFYVQFTDIYDSSNKITLWVKMSADRAVSYTVSCAPNQVWGGYQMAGLNRVYHANTAAGTPLEIVTTYSQEQLDSVSPKTAETVNKNASLYFPATNDSLCMNYEIGHKIFGSGWHNSVLQNSFADPALHDYPWNGFTTGEVYVDFWFEGYNAKTANLIVNSICGEDLTSKEFADEVPPELTVQRTIDVNEGYVGYSYPVFKATATDSYSRGEIPVSTSVYYGYCRPEGTYHDYGKDYLYQLDCADGKFVTQYPGTYAIVYRAKDWNGNKTEKVLTINVDASTEIVPVVGTHPAEEYLTSSICGNIVRLPQIDGYSGGVGALRVGAEVLFGDEKIALKGNGYNGYWFIPEQAGTYTVSVYAEDELGVKSALTYTLTTMMKDGDKLDTYVHLPKYFLEGYDYVLPTLPTTNAKTGAKGVASIKIIDGNGTTDYNGKVKFKADANGNAVVRYYVGENQVDYTVPVLSVMSEFEEIFAKDYFVKSESVNVGMDVDGVILTANADGEVTFVNALLADGASMELKLDPNKAQLSAYEFIFTDAEDASVSVSIGIMENGSANAYLSLNGVQSSVQANEITFQSSTSFTVGYDGTTNKLKCDGKQLSVSETRYGARFNGFPSGKVYLSVAMKGVREEVRATIIGINNQMLNIDTAMDTAEPRIQLAGTYSSLVYALKDEFVIYPAKADDVLTPYLALSVSLTYENEPVKLKDGTLATALTCDRAYDAVLTKAGTYILKYQVKDIGGNTASISYKIQVVDQIAPVISVKDVPKNASLGTVKLPSATAKDDTSKQVQIWAVVIDPSGALIYVSENKFTAINKGMHTVIYYAMDEQGNTSSRTFVIGIK